MKAETACIDNFSVGPRLDLSRNRHISWTYLFETARAAGTKSGLSIRQVYDMPCRELERLGDRDL